MTRRSIAASVVVVWLLALGWLTRREYLSGPRDVLADAALNVAPGATYYRLTLGGQQIGFASSRVDTLLDTVLVEDRMVLEVPALGTVQRVDARTVANLSRALRLRSFDATLRSGDARFAAHGAVDGDSILRVDIESAESPQALRVPLDRPIVLPALLPLQLAFGGDLEVGNTYTMRMFDPVLLQERAVEVAVLAESTLVVPDSAAFAGDSTLWVPARWDTLHAWQVRQRVNGVATEAWIDDMGQVVAATTGVGLAMERTAFEIAYENFRRRTPAATTAGDIVGATAIASNVAIARDALQRLRLRLDGVSAEGFDLDGGRQTLIGDTLVVSREQAAALEADYRLPSLDPELRRYLGSAPLIQTRDPRIQAQARQIVGRDRDPASVARKLTEWVHQTLDKRITVSVPSAVEVLAQRRGDCNEHTVLFVALARAVGLPARTAAGLAYVDGNFYYHAWPEVYLDGWVAVDPTFGQFPADAAHLRFTVGGLARQVELVRLIGQLRVDVLEAS